MDENLIMKFLEAQRTQISKARQATADLDRPRGYTNLSTGLEKYEELLLDGRSLMELILEIHRIHPEETMHILDFGCGHNAALRELITNSSTDVPIVATGISVGDPRTEEEKLFDEKHQILFIDKGDTTPQLSPETYHIIVSRLAVGHLADPLGALVELYNSLRENGIMYVDLSTNALAKKFDSGVEGFEKSIQMVQKLISDLRNKGIDIQSDEKKLVIRKNAVPLSFPHVKISPVVAEGITEMGVYIYE